ncbi:MAG: hypothetical protein QW717_01175 [Candidatus Bathyarchaeia archaeon]
MIHKIKRTFSSLPYRFQKIYRKISTARPSSIALAVIALAIVVFLFGGGLYTVISRPLPSYYSPSLGFILVYPSLSDQFVTDSLIAMTLFSLGIVGLIFMYQSTKYAYNPRQAYLLFMAGAVLLIIAYISIEAVMHYWKGV